MVIRSNTKPVSEEPEEGRLDFIDQVEEKLDRGTMREDLRTAHGLRGRHERRAYLAKKRAEHAKVRGLDSSAKAHRKKVREECRRAAREERGELLMTEED